MGAGVASYKVYKLPTESPLYGGLETAHDNLYPTSSPFGWHDTNGIEGAEYTITRGNNVFAYEDKDDDNSSDGNEPDGGASLNFDFPVDLAQDPRQSNHAAVTNLFYLVNMMHDVTALLGFDEAAGNFQSKNYTGILVKVITSWPKLLTGLQNMKTTQTWSTATILKSIMQTYSTRWDQWCHANVLMD